MRRQTTKTQALQEGDFDNNTSTLRAYRDSSKCLCVCGQGRKKQTNIHDAGNGNKTDHVGKAFAEHAVTLFSDSVLQLPNVTNGLSKPVIIKCYRRFLYY